MTMSEALTGTPAPDEAPGGVAAPPAGAGPTPVPPAPPMEAPAAPVVPHAAAGRDDIDRSLDVLSEVEMSVTVELGRTRLPVRHLLSLSPGSVIELNRSANTPVDILVNDTLFARGEVVVIDDEFGVRITELVRRDGPGRV